MWRLWHRLFGWDYAILCQNCTNFTCIARTRVAPDGVPYVVLAGGRVIFADRQGWTFRMLTGRAE